MFRNAGEAANVCEENRNRLVDAAKLERLRILEHLFHNILGQKPAVVCTCHFLPRQALVRPCVLNRNCRLRRDRADQFEIIRLESGKGIKSIGIDSAVHSRLTNERRADRGTHTLRHNRIDSSKLFIRRRVLRKQGDAISHHLSSNRSANRQLPGMIVQALIASAHSDGIQLHIFRILFPGALCQERHHSVRRSGSENNVSRFGKDGFKIEDRAQRFTHLVKRSKDVCFSLECFENLVS